MTEKLRAALQQALAVICVIDSQSHSDAIARQARNVETAIRAALASPDMEQRAVEMSPEFTDTARAALLWVLWHHQGGSSPVGQPLRFALGMGAHEDLNATQIAEAKRWAAITKSTTAAFHGREQRAGFVMVPPDDSESLRLAVRAVKQTLFRGGSGVSLPADSWIERAFIAGMLAAAHPIEALEGGKTDSGAYGPVHQDTSSTPASASEFRSLVAALRKFGEPGCAIGGELPLNSDQLIALDAANAIERLSSKSASERLRTLAKARAAHEASAAAHHSGSWHAAYEHHLNRHAAMQDLIDVLWPNAEAPDQDASSRSGRMTMEGRQ